MSRIETPEVIVASLATAAALFTFFIAALSRVTDRRNDHRRRLDTIHQTDAIRTDEVFSKVLGQSASVIDIDKTGTMQDRGAEFSFANIPPVDAGSTRLTLIDLQAQGDGLGKAATTGTAEEGNHVYHFERLSTKPLLSKGQSSVFDAWDLLRLWTTKDGGADADSRAWRISTSILGSFIAPRHLNEDAALSRNRAFFFRPHFIEVWDCISTVQTRNLTGGGTEVVCYFGTLPFKFVGKEVVSNSDTNTEMGSASDRAHHVRQFSPLKDHFRRIIHSDTSACSLERPDTNLAIMLVAIDLLRAAVECWMVHVTLLSQRIRGMPRDDYRQEPNANFDSLQNLRTVPRDLQAATDLVFDTALERLGTAGHHGSAAELRSMRIEANAKLKTMKFAVDDLVERFSSYAEKRVAHVHRNQALSVKRLTVLASVFLPISVASGLLSMGTRAVDLGLIWFDVLGVSLFLILMAVTVYQAMRVSHLLLAKWDASVAFSYRAARRRVQVTTTELHTWAGVDALRQWKVPLSRLMLPVCMILVLAPFVLFIGEGMFGSLDRSLGSLAVNLAGVSLGLSALSVANAAWTVYQSNWWRKTASRLRRTK